MAVLNCKAETFVTPRKKPVLLLGFSGMVNSATFPAFQDAIAKHLTADAPNAALDLSGLAYINSSGLGELIRCQDICKKRGGDLVLINVPTDIIKTIRIIGFHTLLKIFPDQDRASQYFDAGAVEAVQKEYARVGPKPPPSGKVRKPRPYKPRFPRTPFEAAITLVTPQQNVFSDILALRWGGQKVGRFKIAKDRTEALSLISPQPPDLIIIDDVISEADELCKDLKSNKSSSLIGLVRLYATGSKSEAEIRILENDRVVEPFEYNELFAVSEAELKRAAEEKKYLVHQLSFECRSTAAAIDAANNLVAEFTRQADFNEYDASELRTAVREAIDNAYRHGNNCDPEKKIRLDCTLDHECASITVSDEGKGFDYTFYLALGKEADAQERARMRQREGKPGGLGIMLMVRCLDDLEYAEGGHICRLKKKYS